MCGSEEGVIKPSYIASSKPARAIQREYFSKENKTSSTIMNLLGTCLSFITFVYYMQGQRFSQSLALQIRNKWNHKSSDLCNCCFLLVLVMRKSSMLVSFSIVQSAEMMLSLTSLWNICRQLCVHAAYPLVHPYAICC